MHNPETSGNFQLLQSKSSIWASIINYLKKNKMFGPDIPLQCKHHPERGIKAAIASDFDKAPEGKHFVSKLSNNLFAMHIFKTIVTQVVVASHANIGCHVDTCALDHVILMTKITLGSSVRNRVLSFVTRDTDARRSARTSVGRVLPLFKRYMYCAELEKT